MMEYDAGDYFAHDGHFDVLGARIAAQAMLHYLHSYDR
jgi:hypothetical protein